MKTKGRCPVCTGDFVVKKDGTLWWHNGDVWQGGWRMRCAGSGKPPREGSVRASSATESERTLEEQ